MWKFDSGWEFKGVWSSIASIHKNWGKSTDALNIEKQEIHLKHEPRGKFWDISGWNYGGFSCIGQETDKEGFFQFR